ncbi:hypothetical protein PSTT_11112 [Puccinia striiformis]|uniref:Aquaporin n=1 Tax=Puccinia striiformis TaxID=27350 RepID=A0A2S4V1N8_9BASI|nr:hypothetical protein PSTT_11112 [Puccinia striiformis]
MNCALFYVACFLAVPQSAFALRTVALRVEVTHEAAAKGQSEQKCLVYNIWRQLLGRRLAWWWYLGYKHLGASLNPLALCGGLGLYLKDAPEAGKKHADHSRLLEIGLKSGGQENCHLYHFN